MYFLLFAQRVALEIILPIERFLDFNVWLNPDEKNSGLLFNIYPIEDQSTMGCWGDRGLKSCKQIKLSTSKEKTQQVTYEYIKGKNYI